MEARPRTVIALGGNAILRRGDSGTIEDQSRRAHEALAPVVDLAARGHSLILTHGNGPVVGNIILRGEAAAGVVPPMPLYIAGADSSGGVGFMLQNTLHNLLQEAGLTREVATVVTQTVVDADDPGFANPTKPIGPFLDKDNARAYAKERGWIVTEQPGGGWRRVVPSPLPTRLVEERSISLLAQAGTIVIAAGGGGVPVTEAPNGALTPVNAVVDKDWSGALLACATGADEFVIIMEADALYSDWGTPHARRVESLSAHEARRLIDSGSFDAGTIGPKLAAAAYASDVCGCTSVLCAPGDLTTAISGDRGTRITRTRG